MAKSTSVFKLQGTFEGITFVRSSAYGDHVRAKRGTHKPAPVNARLKKESKSLVQSNLPAKLFKDAIDPYRGYMLGGTLWRRLLSLFRKQLKEKGKFDFTELVLFDIHEKYTLNKFFAVQSTVTPDKKKSKLQVRLSFSEHPSFKKSKYVDSYVITLIAVYPDLKKKKALTSHVVSPVCKLKDPIVPLFLELDLPPKANEYVICLKLEGCINGVVSNSVMTTALCAINAGRIQ